MKVCSSEVFLFCKKCGEEFNPSVDNHCGKCGADLRPRSFCKKCGAEYDPGADKHCGSCGAELEPRPAWIPQVPSGGGGASRMRCPKCLYHYDETSRFCPSCGEGNPGQVQQSERTPPPPSTSNQFPPLERKKGGFKKFWSGLPALGKVALILGIVLLISGGVIAGVVEANKSGAMESVSGTYTFETLTLTLSSDGNFSASVEPVGEYISGTWETDGSSVSLNSAKTGMKSDSFDIEGDNLRDSDGDIWKKQ